MKYHTKVTGVFIERFWFLIIKSMFSSDSLWRVIIIFASSAKIAATIKCNW